MGKIAKELELLENRVKAKEQNFGLYWERIGGKMVCVPFNNLIVDSDIQNCNKKLWIKKYKGEAKELCLMAKDLGISFGNSDLMIARK